MPAAAALCFLALVLVISCAATLEPSTEGTPGQAESPGLPTAQPTRDALLSPLPTATAPRFVVGVWGSPLPSPPSAGGPSGSHAPQGTPVYGYQVVNTFPHDPSAFTQGLVFEDGSLFEGTGMWGQSTLRRVELETGNVLQNHVLPGEYFGEGITVWADRILQLTWRSHLGWVYDKDSFEQLDTFTYPTEGWGITHDGARLIMSDGTATLHFWDPDSLEEVGQVQVYDDQGPVVRLNELEYIHGLVYANVWQTDRIAIIDPQTGQVVAWIDLTGLLDDPSGGADVLNGIAYDAPGDRLFVTGKWWPKLYEIELTFRLFLPWAAK